MTDRNDRHPLAAEFQLLRPRLIRVAYATLGSLAEAEDCVQEAWLRRLPRKGSPAHRRSEL
jgi:RNA polymerase sigma-70 factor (ECF subfamily)